MSVVAKSRRHADNSILLGSLPIALNSVSYLNASCRQPIENRTKKQLQQYRRVADFEEIIETYRMYPYLSEIARWVIHGNGT